MNTSIRRAGTILVVAALALTGTATLAVADQTDVAPATRTLNPQPEPPG